MKRHSFIGWVVGMVYAVAMLFFGILPHHHANHNNGGDKDCAVCIWQATANNDIPLPSPSITRSSAVIAKCEAPVFVFLPVLFALTTASRAPPVASV